MSLFCDTETWPITRGALAPPIVCVQTSIDDGPIDVRRWRDARAEIVAWLQTGAIDGANISYDLACILADDIRTAPVIFAALDAGRVCDVQLAAKLLDIAAGEYERRTAFGWSLEELSRRAKGPELEKEDGAGAWRLRFKALDGLPIDAYPASAHEYAAKDIAATRAVRKWCEARRAEWERANPGVPWNEYKTGGYHEAHAVQSAFALHLASCQGVLTDPARVEHVHGRVETYLSEIRGDLQAAGLVREDGTRDTRVAARALVDAYAKIGREVPFTAGAEKKEREAREKLAKAEYDVSVRGKPPAGMLRKLSEIREQWHMSTGGTPVIHLPGVQIDADACILAGGDDHRLDPDDLTLLEKYSEYTSANLLRGRIERMREGFVWPLQTRFDPLKETARTSSTQPGEPLVGEQMQNYPRQNGLSAKEKAQERNGEFFIGLRECYTPRPGNVFLIADLEQAELHCLAELCYRLFGYSEMMRLLNEGVDLHWHFAAKSRGMPLADMLAEKSKYKRDRDRAKPANFGFPGGMGPDKFILYSRKGYGIRFERDEVVELKRSWLDTFPEVKEYLAWIGRQVKEGDGTFTYVHPITGFVRGGCEYTAGANHGFQHLCAYGAKQGFYRVTKACFEPESPLFGYRCNNFVHDEAVLEGPEQGAQAAAHEVGRIMAETFNAYVPNCPTTAEGIVSRVWSKHAKRVEGGVWSMPEGAHA